MAENEPIAPGERGLSEKNAFLTGAPYELAKTSTTATPSATGIPPQVIGPQLDSTFSQDFEKQKVDHLKAAAVLTATDAATILPLLSQTPPLVLTSALKQSQGKLSPTSVNSLQVAEWARIVTLDGPQVMHDATAEANRWIDATLLKLPPSVASASSCMDALLIQHFNATSPSDKKLAASEAVKHLTGVKNDKYGINSTNAVYGIGGYGCTELVFGKSSGYTRKFQSTTTQFCPEVWTDTFSEYPSLNALTRTIIHEALHRLRWWLDKGIIDDKPVAYKQLTVAQTTTNPDTYAMFAMEAAKCP